MHGAHARRLGTVPRNRDELAQPVISDLYVPILVKDVARLHVPVDDPAIVQVSQPLADLAHKIGSLLRPHTIGLGDQQVSQRRPGDVLHHDEVLALGTLLHVEDLHQVRALEVHAG